MVFLSHVVLLSPVVLLSLETYLLASVDFCWLSCADLQTITWTANIMKNLISLYVMINELSFFIFGIAPIISGLLTISNVIHWADRKRTLPWLHLVSMKYFLTLRFEFHYHFEMLSVGLDSRYSLIMCADDD
jgi:hypothetical protein